MMNILLLEDYSFIGSMVRQLIEASDYSISKSLNWLNRLAVLGYIEQNKPDTIIFCASFENEDTFLDADILREIRKSYHRAQIMLVVEKHSRHVNELALDCDAEWVICAEEIELLDKVLQRIDRKHKAFIREHKEKMQNLFVDYIKDERRLNPGDKKLLFKDYHDEKYFQVVIVRILPPYRKRSGFDGDNIVSLKGCDILVNRLEKLKKHLIAKDGPDVLICLMGSNDELKYAKRQLEKYTRDMSEFNLAISSSASWVCMGSVVRSIKDISKSYHDAKELLNERTFKKSIDILEEQKHRENINDEERIEIFDVRKTLLNSLETFEEQTIHKTFMQLKSNILSITNFTGKNLFSVYKTLMSAFFQELESKEANLSELAADYDSVYKEYEYFWNVDDVFDCMESFFIEGVRILQAKEEDSLPLPIVLAKRYILSYFNMPLTLKEISAHVGMNENYFSDYFSKHVNMTFKQYQTDLRIRYSKQMLLDKRYSMEDISETVGYSDVKYFSRVFKRVTGKAPGEYRAKYHKISDKT